MELVKVVCTHKERELPDKFEFQIRKDMPLTIFKSVLFDVFTGPKCFRLRLYYGDREVDPYKPLGYYLNGDNEVKLEYSMQYFGL